MPIHTPIALASLISLRAIYHRLLGERHPDQGRFMRVIRILGVVIGVVIVAVLIREVGWANIQHTLGMLGWGYAIVLTYPISWILLNTTGWRMALHAQYARIPIVQLAQIRLAGETFNSLLPSGYVGGEPLKAKLLSRSIPTQEATSSVLIAKAAQSVGLVLFVSLGLTLGGNKSQTSMLHHPKTLWALAMLTIGIFLFTLLLTRRSFSRIGKWLHELTGHPWLQKQEGWLVSLDDSIGAFYREGKIRFLASVLWHGGGWIAGALEVAVIFYMIGHAVTLREAWFIGAMAQLAAVIGLFSPAGVGLYEGGHYLAASILGLPPALGVSVALIRRVRELFWDCVGLWLFWWSSKATHRGQC
jgi:glycosyltransferase 2 family protein